MTKNQINMIEGSYKNWLNAKDNRIDVLHISLESVIVIDSIESKINNKVWRIHMSFGNGLITGGGAEVIENLDQKIRDIKLKNLGI